MRRLAVLGHPVAHSRSPRMHAAALAAMGMSGQWSYEAIDVAPGELESRVRQMPAEGFAGANVTVPHKAAALALSDRSTDRAREIGAANTLSFTEAGIEADNTDGLGFLAAVGAPGENIQTLVLGAGGTARAVLWALSRYRVVPRVWNRTASRAAEICAELGGVPVGAEEADGASFELIVNTTSSGLDGGDPFAELPLSREGLGSGQVVVDMVYGDRPSEILAAAAAAGARTVDGLEMLACQGAISFEIWTGRRPPLEVMREAARSG